MKIFDCFPLFNEIEILQLRLELLYDHVDKFVLVESNQSFTLANSPKQLSYEANKDKFRRFSDKIIHIVLEDQFNPNDPWGNEHIQRNAIIDGLGFAKPDDLILMSDVDEIPNPAFFKLAGDLCSLGQKVTFKQRMFRYYLNLRCTHEFWKGTRAISRFRLKRDFGDSLERLRHFDGKFLEDSGWHYTGMGGVDKFLKKMESFSHADICATPTYMDKDNVKKLFKEKVLGQGRDIHHFNSATYKIETEPSEFLPPIEGVEDKYSHLIYREGITEF